MHFQANFSSVCKSYIDSVVLPGSNDTGALGLLVRDGLYLWTPPGDGWALSASLLGRPPNLPTSYYTYLLQCQWGSDKLPWALL